MSANSFKAISFKLQILFIDFIFLLVYLQTVIFNKENVFNHCAVVRCLGTTE